MTLKKIAKKIEEATLALGVALEQERAASKYCCEKGKACDLANKLVKDLEEEYAQAVVAYGQRSGQK